MTTIEERATVSDRDIQQAEYDGRWAGEGYGGEGQGYTPAFLSFMREHVGGRPADARRALEIGCGDGFFSHQLSKLGCAVTGIDLSPVGVERAKKLTPGGTFQTADLSKPLPFADGAFDVVWTSEVMEHLFSPAVAIGEAARVMKRGGVLLITVPFHGLLKNLAIAMFAFDRHYDPEYPHLRFFTINTLSGLVRKAGLEVVEARTCGSQLGWLRDTLFPTNILLAARKA